MVRTTTRKNVRILLVGDKLVGKTSIILSLVSEEFPEEVPFRAEEITIPADVTPELVPTHIVDYCEAEQSEESLTDEIKKAHVICVVYSVVDDNTFSRVSSHWLPFIRKCTSDTQHCPIVLVGNKVDLINDSTYETASYIMDEYPEIESFVECSAKTLLNISEMFYYAQNAVLHPTSPVFNTDTQELTEACKKALTRIFTICDTDNDGVLCDKELNNFQKRCFDTPLRKEAVEDIKSIISKNIEGGVSETNGITLKGFIFLHNLFMQRGRSQTTWAVLRRFGYEENLELAKEYLCPKLVVPHGCSVELSDRGQQFFSLLFEKYDRDKDNALSSKKLKELFSICPQVPFNETIVNMVPTNSKGWINSEGWLCFWTYTTFYSYTTTLEYLAYLGYPVTDSENQTSALYVTREKKMDMLKKQSLRNVYVCHVLGEKGSGKATLCRAHLGRAKEDDVEIDVPNGRGTINISHVYGQEKYIILRNIDVSDAAEPLMPSDVNCDVACLVYDSSHTRSFEYVARIYLKYFENSGIPVLIVASKSDLGTVRQNYMLQPETFCQENNLLMPIMFSSLKQKKELFVKLATMAAFPGHKASAVLSESHVYNLGLMRNCEIFTIRRTGISITVIVIIGVLLAKLMKSEKNSR